MGVGVLGGSTVNSITPLFLHAMMHTSAILDKIKDSAYSFKICKGKLASQKLQQVHLAVLEVVHGESFHSQVTMGYPFYPPSRYTMSCTHIREWHKHKTNLLHTNSKSIKGTFFLSLLSCCRSRRSRRQKYWVISTHPRKLVDSFGQLLGQLQRRAAKTCLALRTTMPCKVRQISMRLWGFPLVFSLESSSRRSM